MAGEAANVPELRFPEFEGEWETESIERLATVSTGSRDTQNRIEGGSYPFFVRSDTVEKIDTFSFDGEAILTSGDGVGVGKNIHYINGKFDYHQRVYAIRDFSEKLYGKFFYQFFKEHFLKRVMRLSAKNSVDSVRMSMITEMQTPRPILPEQQKIATFLGAVDGKIGQLEKKKALLEDYKKGCMQKLFSRTLRFKEDNGNDFPDWKEKRLGERVGKVGSGVTPKGGSTAYSDMGIPLIRSQNVRNGHLDLQDVVFISDKIHENMKSSIVQPGDVLFNITGASIGRSCVVPISTSVANVNQHVCIIRTHKDNDPRFLQLFLVSRLGKKQVWQAQGGSGREGLNFENVRAFKTNFPTLTEQQKIANFLTAIDDKITLTTTQLTQAQTFKKGLLQQMFV